MKNYESFGRAIIHCHTIFSDGLTTIPEFFDSCKAVNIDVAVIMDHDTTEGAKKAIEYGKINNKRTQIIGGLESTFAPPWEPFSHVGFIFPPGTPIVDITPFNGFENAIAEARNKNPDTLVVLVHPAITITVRRNLQRFLPQVDIVETNCKLNAPEINKAVNHWNESHEKKISKSSGADPHKKYPYDKSWNYITLFPGKTGEDLIQALIDGTTIPITDNLPTIPPTPIMTIRQNYKAIFEQFPKVISGIYHSSRR